MVNIIEELKSDKLREKSKNNLKELIRICNCLGRKYLELQEYELAIDEHKEELSFSEQLKCKKSEAIARRALGECYSELGHHQKALNQHKKYLKLSQQLNDRVEIQRAFATIGRTHLIHSQDANNHNNQNALNESLKAFKIALQLCDHLPEVGLKELSEMRSRLFLNLGLVYENLGQYDESQKWLNKSITLNKAYDLKEDLFRSQISSASVHEKNKNLEMAKSAYEEALKTAKALKDKIKICDTLILKGLILMRLEKFEDSRRDFKKAYKVKSPVSEDHSKATRYLKVSSIVCDDLRKLNKCDNYDDKIKYCDRLGDHFVEMDLFEIAVQFYEKQLLNARIADKSDSDIAKIYVSIAQTYADNEQYEKAVENFTHELNCNRGNDVEECKSLIKIAEMKEYLNKEELNEDIISTYELAIEKIGNKDQILLSNILQRYSSFLESHNVNSDRLSEIKTMSLSVGRQRETEIETVESETEDIYENYDLNDISETSDSESDEEINTSRPKRNRTKKVVIKRNEKGETPLHRACIEGKLKQVEKLLETGHVVNVRDNSGWTPLHEAVNHGWLEIVELLLDNKANINDRGGQYCDGLTPLHDACDNGLISIARLLIKKGANVTILNDYKQTALDSLREWKKRCSDLSDEDREDCELFEQELEEALNKAGFVRKENPISRSKRSPVYSPDSSPERPDACQSSSRNRFPDSRTNNSLLKERDFNLDFDDPRVARNEYQSTITNLRRHKDPNRDLFESRLLKRTKIPALLNEDECIDDEQWLVNDVPTAPKRSCLDAFDAFGAKKIKSKDFNEPPKRRKPKPPTSKSNIEDDNQIDILSSDEEIKTESNLSVVNKQEVTKNTQKTPEPSLRSHSNAISIRVHYRDNKNTLILIPVLNLSSNCLWLNREASKRYFEKFDEKPIISLETMDGALLSDEDCVLDVITGDLKEVRAKIESWVLVAPHIRYQELCERYQIEPISDIINELQMTQINGSLKFTNTNIPVDHIKPIFGALKRQNSVREIDISCSNIIFDDMKNSLNCFPSLPNLQILNLKCTASCLQSLEELIAKDCPNLVEINLSFNSLGDHFSDTVAKLVKNFVKLNVLDLSACDLSDRFLENDDLKDSIKYSRLRSIILDYNSIETELIEKYRNIKQ